MNNSSRDRSEPSVPAALSRAWFPWAVTILFPHGVLFRDEESEMRRKLVESDLVECVIGIGKNLFFNSPMEACIVICRTHKTIEHRGKVLFINARNEVTRKNSQSYLEDSHIERIASTYHSFISIEGFSSVVSIEQIMANDGKLSIALYVRGTENEANEQVTVDDAIADWLSSAGIVYENYNTLCNIITGA